MHNMCLGVQTEDLKWFLRILIFMCHMVIFMKFRYGRIAKMGVL